MAMHEKGAQIANRSRAHAGTHAVSHRGAATSENTDDDPRDWRADEPVSIASYLNCFTIIIITTNPSNTDIIARTRNRRCVHRNSERHIYGQLSDSTSAQRE